ncbi:MAG: hydrolase [Gammaproteobacteria bacterium]|nr:hydrolase [Gammaproteobacteria bacterium]
MEPRKTDCSRHCSGTHRTGVITGTFRPAWWLPTSHLQTLWPVLFRPRPTLNLTSERLELSDGDFLDIAWSHDNAKGPLVLVIHGLEGSIHSHYAAGLMDQLARNGLRPVFMHFRGCSGEPNRLSRSYHSGDTGDLSMVVDHIEKVAERPVRAIIGFSLGGNVLLKWLGEKCARATLQTAIAISVPFRLEDCAQRLEQGISRLYQWYLLRSLKQGYRAKFSLRPSPLQVDLDRLRTFRAFDDRITAPLHGFRNVDHYYQESSSIGYLRGINVDTLIIHALDDPFMWPSTVPLSRELSPKIRLELSPNGGHVGFVGGRYPWRAEYWLDRRIIGHLADTLTYFPRNERRGLNPPSPYSQQ